MQRALVRSSEATQDTDVTVSGWEPVVLGVGVPRSHLCLCCLTFSGPGLSRGGLSYCLPCWQERQSGELCAHSPNGGLTESPVDELSSVPAH